MASQSEGAIRLFVLGDARIETPKGVIEPKAEMVFSSALYLILCRGQSVARRDLEELLWPDASPPTASHRLRQTLVKLKKVGVPVQAAGMTRLCLSANTASTDLETTVEARLRLPTTQWGDLTVLSGYDPTFSPGFSRWLDEKRTIITGSLTRLILLQLGQFRSKGLWAEVETAAVTLLRLAPLNEEATLALAESLTMRGSKLEGVQVLDAYLSEVGDERDDLRLPASILRKRIVDRMPAHARSPPASTRPSPSCKSPAHT